MASVSTGKGLTASRGRISLLNSGAPVARQQPGGLPDCSRWLIRLQPETAPDRIPKNALHPGRGASDHRRNNACDFHEPALSPGLLDDESWSAHLSRVARTVALVAGRSGPRAGQRARDCWRRGRSCSPAHIVAFDLLSRGFHAGIKEGVVGVGS